MRQVTEQKPQRATVSSASASHRASVPLTKPRSSRGNDEPHTYPAMALGLMLVFGILLGLLFAAMISSFIGGGAGGTPGATAKPSAIASQQDAKLQTQQRTDAIRANTAPEDRDVRILGCGVDTTGYASARVLITNSTDTTATYYVRVLFTAASDGRTISDDVASAKRLPPGSTAPLQTVNAVEQASGESVLCRLGSVTRF